jgi:hypothetical protein
MHDDPLKDPNIAAAFNQAEKMAGLKPGTVSAYDRALILAQTNLLLGLAKNDTQTVAMVSSIIRAGSTMGDFMPPIKSWASAEGVAVEQPSIAAAAGMSPVMLLALAFGAYWLFIK